MVGFLIFGKFFHRMKNLITCILFLFSNESFYTFNLALVGALRGVIKISDLRIMEIFIFKVSQIMKFIFITLSSKL